MCSVQWAVSIVLSITLFETSNAYAYASLPFFPAPRSHLSNVLIFDIEAGQIAVGLAMAAVN